MKKVITAAFKKGLEIDVDFCPPLIYINRSDSDEKLRDLLMKTDVPRVGLQLKFEDDVCTKCAMKIRLSETRPKVRVAVVNPGSDKCVAYNTSYCHPELIPKYSMLVKVIGTIIYIATATMSKKFGGPEFYNNSEYCVHCHGAPESNGCCQIDEKVHIKEGCTIEVDHSSKIRT